MSPVEIYTTRYCPYCHAAKALLKKKGVNFSEIDVGRDWERRGEMIQRANGRTTVPQTNAQRAKHRPDTLDRAGKLDPILAEGKAYP